MKVAGMDITSPRSIFVLTSHHLQTITWKKRTRTNICLDTLQRPTIVDLPKNQERDPYIEAYCRDPHYD